MSPPLLRRTTVLPEYTVAPAAATSASWSLEVGIDICLAVVILPTATLGSPLHPELRTKPGLGPETSMGSTRPERPNTGDPQVRRLSSLVCNGPLISSPATNWISLQPLPARAARYLPPQLVCAVSRSELVDSACGSIVSKSVK